METRGIEPRASRMRSERSTIWATPPAQALAAVNFILSNFLITVSSNVFPHLGKRALPSPVQVIDEHT